MHSMLRRLGVSLTLILAPLAAVAQQFPPGPATTVQAPALGPSAGIEFQLATEFLSPNDSRIDGGSSLFRLAFRTDPASAVFMFYERITETFTFRNGGPPVAAGGVAAPASVPVAPGESTIDAVGVGLSFGATRLEIMTGRAATTVTAQGQGTAPGSSLSSSDPIVDLGFFWAYKPGNQRALIDVGLVYRQHRLAAGLPGNTIVTTSTQTKTLNDLGGLVARLGIGYAF